MGNIENQLGNVRKGVLGKISSLTITEFLEKYPDKKAKDIKMEINEIRQNPPVENIATIKHDGEMIVKIKRVGPDAHDAFEDIIFSEYSHDVEPLLKKVAEQYNKLYLYSPEQWRQFHYKGGEQ